MSDERGNPDTYEITWRTGHIERVLAHQISWPGQAAQMMRGYFSPVAEVLAGVATAAASQPRTRMHFHAEIEGHWTLTLACDEEDLLSVRLVTESEPIPGVQP